MTEKNQNILQIEDNKEEWSDISFYSVKQQKVGNVVMWSVFLGLASRIWLHFNPAFVENDMYRSALKSDVQSEKYFNDWNLSTRMIYISNFP